MATNFLRFYRAGSVNGMVFTVGVACGLGVGRMLTELGGMGKLFCSSPASSVSNSGTVSFFSHG